MFTTAKSRLWRGGLRGKAFCSIGMTASARCPDSTSEPASRHPGQSTGRGKNCCHPVSLSAAKNLSHCDRSFSHFPPFPLFLLLHHPQPAEWLPICDSVILPRPGGSGATIRIL